jgi:hypothetical protein
MRVGYSPLIDKEPLKYVANGEIGIVTGPFRRRGSNISLDNLRKVCTTSCE